MVSRTPCSESTQGQHFCLSVVSHVQCGCSAVVAGWKRAVIQGAYDPLPLNRRCVRGCLA